MEQKMDRNVIKEMVMTGNINLSFKRFPSYNPRLDGEWNLLDCLRHYFSFYREMSGRVDSMEEHQQSQQQVSISKWVSQCDGNPKIWRIKSYLSTCIAIFSFFIEWN